jgi:hypothetical protein
VSPLPPSSQHTHPLPSLGRRSRGGPRLWAGGGRAGRRQPQRGGARTGWAARRPSTIRCGAGDTAAASVASPLVPGSVGRAAGGFRGLGLSHLGRKKQGEAPGVRCLLRAAESRAVQTLKTRPGGAPVRLACRRPCPERRPASPVRRPGFPVPGCRDSTLPGVGDGWPGAHRAAGQGPRRGLQRPSPGECSGPRPVAPLGVWAGPPRLLAQWPRRSWAAPARPPSWQPSGSRSSP